MNNTKISFAIKLINNIFNVKILSILLVVTFLLSAIFSSNPRASFFYGDVFDYNVVFFLTMFVLLYVMNNYSNRKSYIFEKKFITIDKAALLWPVFISIICFPLLSITKALPYINWGYMSATGLLTAIIMLFSVFFFLKKWIYKIIASALLIVSMTAFLSGEMAMHLPNTVAQNVSMRILNIFKVNFQSDPFLVTKEGSVS